MNFYKHYSFDLWMTLIKSNPFFKQERANFFYTNLNSYKKSIEEIVSIFRRVDLMCNAINEKAGKNLDAEEMYLMVIAEINNYSTSFDDIDIAGLYGEMEELIFKYHPVVYSDDTINVLNQLRMQGNSSFSILSNTAFIKGNTLRKVLKIIGLDDFFGFQLYSDETGTSKPNKQLFQLMLDKVIEYRNEPGMDIKQIIHVGDNVKADIGGANAIGISSYLINNNGKTILNLLDEWL